MLLIPLLAGRPTSAPCLFISDSKVWLHTLFYHGRGWVYKVIMVLFLDPQQRCTLNQRTRLTSMVLHQMEESAALSVSLSLRWKRDASGGKVMQDGKPVLEFVAIKRKDTGDWALPGVSG